MYIPTRRLLQESEKYYKLLKSVNCPSLNVLVKFNRHGWNHVIYDGTGHRRSEAQIRLRLILLKDVKQAIQNHQGYPETLTKEGEYHYYSVRRGRKTKNPL